MEHDSAFGENPYEAPRSDLRKDWDTGLLGSGPAQVRFEAIGEAWELLKDKLSTWVLIVLIAGACNMGVSLLSNGVNQALMIGMNGGKADQMTFGIIFLLVQLVFIVISVCVQAYFTGGMFYVAAKHVRGEPIEVGDVFKASDVLPSLIGASLLVGLATVGGFLLLIIPGLYIAGRLMFTIPLIADGKRGAIEAMGMSWRALEGQGWMALAFFLVVSIVSSLGLILCCIGVLLTAPLYQLSIAVLYRDFFSKTKPGAADWIQEV